MGKGTGTGFKTAHDIRFSLENTYLSDDVYENRFGIYNNNNNTSFTSTHV